MERLSRIDMLIELLKDEPDDLFLNYALALEYSGNPGTLTEAEELFKKVLGLNPDYIAAYYHLAKLFEGRLKNAEALQYYNIGLLKAKELKDNKAINEFGEAIFLLED